MNLRDEEELTYTITIRRYEIVSRLVTSDGEIIAGSATHFVRPINIDGVTNFVKKSVYRIADMVGEAVYIAEGGLGE